MRWISQRLCGLFTQHREFMRVIRADRRFMHLRCGNCGYESTGWDLVKTSEPTGGFLDP